MAKINIIYADKGIFRGNDPAGFKPTNYKININHPKINPLWRNFRKKNGHPTAMAFSDKERFHFEDIIFRMIEKGVIVITDVKEDKK